MISVMELYETDYWQVKLHPAQENLGKCVLVAKSQVSSLSELSDSEWVDFGRIIKQLEIVIQKVFNPTHFNHKCLMNDSFNPDGSQNHKPVAHWHFMPRYAGKVEFDGVDFSEPEYPNTHKEKKDLSSDVLEKIADIIKENLS